MAPDEVPSLPSADLGNVQAPLFMPVPGPEAPPAAPPADAPAAGSGNGPPAGVAAGVPGEAPARRGRGRHAAPRRAPRAADPDAPARRIWTRRLYVLVLCGLVLITIDAVVCVRVRDATPPPAVVTAQRVVATAPGTTTPLPWPAVGQAAVALPASGFELASPHETAVPIASLTKLMTTYVVLHDHPLPDGDAGPVLTMTQSNVTDFDDDTGDDESSIPVAVGEQLTERQVLDGLLVHSANNFADALAVWDAGSVPAFVAKMNATAAALGMTQTHYVDASGFDPQSMSTAGDLLKVASRDMAIPAVREAVAMSSVTLPVAGQVGTYTPLLGTDGVIGMKSGYTSQAGGCDVMAALRSVAGRPVVVLAAVTGQGTADPLSAAGNAALVLADAAAAQIKVVPVLAPGTTVGTATVGSAEVGVRATGALSVLAWPGQQVRVTFAVVAAPRSGSPAGTAVGIALVRLGSQRDAVPAVTSGALPAQSLLNRIF